MAVFATKNYYICMIIELIFNSTNSIPLTDKKHKNSFNLLHLCVVRSHYLVSKHKHSERFLNDAVVIVYRAHKKHYYYYRYLVGQIQYRFTEKFNIRNHSICSDYVCVCTHSLVFQTPPFGIRSVCESSMF